MHNWSAVSDLFGLKKQSITGFFTLFQFDQTPHPTLNLPCKSKNRPTILVYTPSFPHLRVFMHGDAFMNTEVSSIHSTVLMTLLLNTERKLTQPWTAQHELDFWMPNRPIELHPYVGLEFAVRQKRQN